MELSWQEETCITMPLSRIVSRTIKKNHNSMLAVITILSQFRFHQKSQIYTKVITVLFKIWGLFGCGYNVILDFWSR